MKVGKDFIWVTQENNKLFMWADEPIKKDGRWIGERPVVNSVWYNVINKVFHGKQIDEPELVWTK